MKRFVHVLSLLLALAPLRCAYDLTGGTSNSENCRITGMILDSSGARAASTVVTVLPFNFNPRTDELPPACTDTTDANGRYVVTVAAPFAAQYHALATHLQTRARVLIVGITPPLQGDTAAVLTGTLRKSGAIKVLLNEATAIHGDYVYIPGTSLYAPVVNGVAQIDSAPAGYIPALYHVDVSDASKSHVIQTAFSVSPDAVTMISDLAEWRFSAPLHLNTTASGAGVAGNVMDFPVLVRLSPAQFDFSQAAASGADIRFTKSDNMTPLPYEIEQWDSAGLSATLWVRVDTVYGNSSDRYFVMHWGASTGPATVSHSKGSAVFDTATGFQGVWHLNEEGFASPARDATGNGYDGVATATSAVPGEIGAAQAFNGISSYIEMPGTANGRLNFPLHGCYSVSAWVHADSLDGGYHMIVGKGHEQYYLKLMGPNEPYWEFVEYEDQVGWQQTDFPATAKQWKYLVGVRNGNAQYLYIDGQLADSTIQAGNAPPLPARNTGCNVSVGRYAEFVTRDDQGYAWFKGKIDEVRMCNTVPSADCIKLCYMNQRQDNRLVVFGKKEAELQNDRVTK
jgi:hypothetical protein